MFVYTLPNGGLIVFRNRDLDLFFLTEANLIFDHDGRLDMSAVYVGGKIKLRNALQCRRKLLVDHRIFPFDGRRDRFDLKTVKILNFNAQIKIHHGSLFENALGIAPLAANSSQAAIVRKTAVSKIQSDTKRAFSNGKAVLHAPPPRFARKGFDHNAYFLIVDD